MSSMRSDVLTFPCPFTFKVIGPSGADFEGAVFQIFQKQFPKMSEAAIESKASKKDNYTALSITVTVDSQKQLDDTYQALTDEPLVLFAL